MHALPWNSGPSRALSLSKGPRKACAITVGFSVCVRTRLVDSQWHKTGWEMIQPQRGERAALTHTLQPLWSMLLAGPSFFRDDLLSYL